MKTNVELVLFRIDKLDNVEANFNQQSYRIVCRTALNTALMSKEGSHTNKQMVVARQLSHFQSSIFYFVSVVDYSLSSLPQSIVWLATSESQRSDAREFVFCRPPNLVMRNRLHLTRQLGPSTI